MHAPGINISFRGSFGLLSVMWSVDVNMMATTLDEKGSISRHPQWAIGLRYFFVYIARADNNNQCSKMPQIE